MDPVQQRLKQLYEIKAKLEDRGMGLVGGSKNDPWQRFVAKQRAKGITNMTQISEMYQGSKEQKEAKKNKKRRAEQKVKKGRPTSLSKEYTMNLLADVCKQKGGVPKFSCTKLGRKGKITRADLEILGL